MLPLKFNRRESVSVRAARLVPGNVDDPDWREKRDGDTARQREGKRGPRAETNDTAGSKRGVIPPDREVNSSATKDINATKGYVRNC